MLGILRSRFVVDLTDRVTDSGVVAPHFMWILRDFALEMNQTREQYLEGALTTTKENRFDRNT